ncbi:MAG TPA: thiamine pyrophosphate-binding protein [Casimicrobiaceae bacterium]|nr:thiamine pyrophosphate-binding protein [Casimicrobiaceae bacterium]
MNPPSTTAERVARFLAARGPARVFGLQGGHIQPIWDRLVASGTAIVDVRHEGAAVHMATAHALLTGELGVALVTSGPGVTNCVTSIANADLERASVLVIGGCPPARQDNMGPLQGTPHVEVLRPITRVARTLRIADQVIRELDQAVGAALGAYGVPGPAYVEIPTDVLRTPIADAAALPEYLTRRALPRTRPDPLAIDAAATLLRSAKRPLVISGRGAARAPDALVALLDASGALYLDTQESRGLVGTNHPAYVGAMRAAAMQETDLVLTVGRRLDYQLGYGSPAAFPAARFVRIAEHAGERSDNRAGEVEIAGDVAVALTALADAVRGGAQAADAEWRERLRSKHVQRSERYLASLAATPAGADGRMHPNRIFAALRELLHDDAIGIADGGDILSFARLGLSTSTYLDAGAFGCLGVGVPFANAAALAFPDRQVTAICGDGAFGLHAMEIDTAARHGCKAVYVIANNAAWNIERVDQERNYGGRVSGTTLGDSDYAAMARAFGLAAERVSDAAALPEALARAFDRAPALVDVVVTRDTLSSDLEKGLSLVPDYQPLTAWDNAERERLRVAS